VHSLLLQQRIPLKIFRVVMLMNRYIEEEILLSPFMSEGNINYLPYNAVNINIMNIENSLLEIEDEDFIFVFG
jgi:hypothetical protein